MSLGTEILEEIVKEGLVRAECEGLCVWAANTAEVLEALVMKYAPKITADIKTDSE